VAKAKDPKPTEEVLTTEQQRQLLLEKAKKDGHIDQRDIIAVIPETVENAEILDALYTDLADSNIEITTTGPDPENFTDEWAEEGDAEDDELNSDAAVYLEDDIADDSVRLYVKLVRFHYSALTKSWPWRSAWWLVTRLPKTRWPKRTCVWWCLSPSATLVVGWTY
jgi:hypothetical protein